MGYDLEYRTVALQIAWEESPTQRGLFVVLLLRNRYYQCALAQAAGPGATDVAT